MPVCDLHASSKKENIHMRPFWKRMESISFSGIRLVEYNNRNIKWSHNGSFSNPVFLFSEFSTKWTKYPDVKTFHFSDSLF